MSKRRNKKTVEEKQCKNKELDQAREKTRIHFRGGGSCRICLNSRATQTWPLFFWTAQDCARPAGGPNMHLNILKEIFTDGDQADFECDIGYTSAGGSSSITCTAGSWSTVTLKCERRNCGYPGEVLHGEIHYPKENLFGDHIEITCYEGYRLVGNSRITCGAAGWMGMLPRCEEVTCDEAPQVKDATFTPYKDTYNYGEVVQYSCQNGLTLNGSASIECSDDGTFKPDPPTCIRVQCEDLHNPNLVWVSGSQPPHGYKATLTYRCRTGYRIVGQPTLTCDINSLWSPGLPRCDAAAASYGVLRWSQQGRQKRLVEEKATKDEEEVALLDGMGLKQSPTGSGQASGEGHRG